MVREIEKVERESCFDPEDLPQDGIEFEHWCADRFRIFGWNSEVTRAGGDQGIDIIIERDGNKIGIQTKLFSSPVGNKAVQEAHAGKVYYGLAKVAVLSNAGFTASATKLAMSTGVILMSQYDIPVAHKILLEAAQGITSDRSPPEPN